MENDNIQEAIRLLNEANEICKNANSITELDEETKKRFYEKLEEAKAQLNQSTEKPPVNVPGEATTESSTLSSNITQPAKKLGWWARRRELKAIAKEELELFKEFKKLSDRVRGTADDPYGNASPAQRARLDYILARLNELEKQVSTL